MTAIICGPSVYRFEGVTFEIHSHFGPHPLTKDGRPKAQIPGSFWALWDRFKALPNKDDYLVHQGGCRVI